MMSTFCAIIVKITTQPQHNQTKPNNQQINESWVLHKNEFAHPTHQELYLQLKSNTGQLQGSLG